MKPLVAPAWFGGRQRQTEREREATGRPMDPAAASTVLVVPTSTTIDFPGPVTFGIQGWRQIIPGDRARARIDETNDPSAGACSAIMPLIVA